MQIVPIASGKGGVGKSLVAANLSIALAQAGRRVILADLDLGGSNLHTILGLSSVPRGIGTYLTNPKGKLEEIILETEYSGLRFLPGDSEIPGMANLKSSQKRMLLRKLQALDADYLVMDLGAGTNFNTLDFFLISGRGIIVTAPTLTATLNAYLFLKNSVFRIMSASFKQKSPAWEYLESLKHEERSLQRVYVPRLLEEIGRVDLESRTAYDNRVGGFRPRLILNMLDNPQDGDKAGKIRRSCGEYLAIDMEHLGIIYRDHLQDVALASRLPIIIYKPESILAQAVYRIADKIMQQEGEVSAPVGFPDFEDSYEEAEMEAQVDFDEKIKSLEDLLRSGALTEGDLIETIRTQQYEISTLRKENQLIKTKLVRAVAAGFKL